MDQPLPASAQRVQDTLRALGYACQVQELPASTRSAVEAAQAVSCDVAQIAKSLIFRRKQTHTPVLVIASGINRVNEKKIGEYLGESIGKANADYVREKTGFAIGGIPPVSHVEPIETLIDEDLFQYDVIWAAAGTPNAVFQLTPQDLVQMTTGTVVSVT